MAKENEIVLFETEDKEITLNVKVNQDTVWLNRNQMADLFGRDVKTIGKHINNAVREELSDQVVVAKFATTTQHGAIEGKTQTHMTEYYNLDVIISVGYRVKSQRGIEFRRWANKVLKELCAYADIIVPNITEASLMTGMEYKEEYDECYIKELLARLTELGSKISVLTGVSLEKGKTGVMGYDKEKDEYYIYQNRRIDASYHGTGDLFSSTCIGEIMRGKNWKEAMQIAADYTAHTIEVTLQNPKKLWYGVDFEATLPELIKM